MKKDIKKIRLNRRQLEAVKHQKGPLLIIAGAGTGKTTVVTERIKYLVKKELAKPAEILALTFTEKAAQEMEERVDIAMPYGYTQMSISTFHSFCDRVLKDQALHIGFNPRFKLMTQSESIQFVRNNLFKFNLDYFRPLGNPTKFVDGMLNHFSRLQDEDVDPKEYGQFIKKLKGNKKSKTEDKNQEIAKWEELAEAYKKYEELKVGEGVVDFGDLIVKTLKLFRDRRNVLSEYKSKFKYILVDEFQDTNYAQTQLAILLAGKGKNANITVTGDDDQSIYRFRGAAVSNIIQFRKVYKNSKIVVLTKNYRSTQEILDRAYQLIQFNNPDRMEEVEAIDKKLKTFNKEKAFPITFIHQKRVENEAEEVVKEIEKLTQKKYSYKDIAILVRANNHAEVFTRALARRSIPFQFLGPGRLFKQPEILDLISYLKVLDNFEDSVSFFRLLSSDYFKIPPKDLVRLGNYSRKYNLSLFETCERIEEIYVDQKTKDAVKKTIKIIEKHLKLIRKETAGQLLYFFLEETDLLPKLLNPDSPVAERKAANISKFFDKLKSYEVDHEDATVSVVVDWIDLSSELGESPLASDIDWIDINAVNLLTVHSAKGLEFGVVFLVNLVGNRFPTIERREQIPIPEKLIKEILPKGDFHLQEERRLFYVGMTRAKERLYFTAADYYGEGKREKKLSPFIFESLGDGVIASESKDKGKQLSFMSFESLGEKETLTQETKLHLDYLSYSQIETFRICPLHYKLRYILKVPTPPSAALSFGTSIHAAIRDFYILVKKGKRPTEKLIIEMLNQNWVREGFRSKSHEKSYLKKGEMYLKQFIKKEYDSKKLPLLMEQSFVVPLPPFKNKRRLKIGGKIDRVDLLDKGAIEIIDYKTGANIPTQRQIDHDLQLSFYALAAKSLEEKPFGKKEDETNLSLYYFDNQRKIETKRTKPQLKETIKEIYQWRDKIEESDFKCSKSYLCKNCEYKLMCNS